MTEQKQTELQQEDAANVVKLNPKKGIKRPKTMQEQQAHAKAVKEHKKLVAKHTKDFKNWKAALRDMINKETQCIISDDGKDATFLLPKRLVRLVWEVTIKERIRAEVAQHGEEGAAARAIARLRQEIEQGMGHRLEPAQAEPQQTTTDSNQPEPNLTEGQEPTELNDLLTDISDIFSEQEEG